MEDSGALIKSKLKVYGRQRKKTKEKDRDNAKTCLRQGGAEGAEIRRKDS
jgi:hypothetical protein